MNLREEGWESVEEVYMALLAGCCKKEKGKEVYLSS
jgi:hypothetical protein